ncbi:MAG TPA: hypothetical protein VFM99_02840, partial [Chitinophagales bacterium]|nr:hypothetical protein [Chitinophagales bacterium]
NTSSSKPTFNYATPSDRNSGKTTQDNSYRFDKPANNNNSSNTYQKPEFTYPEKSNERIDNKYSQPPSKSSRNEVAPEKPKNNWFENKSSQSNKSSGWNNNSSKTQPSYRSSPPSTSPSPSINSGGSSSGGRSGGGSSSISSGGGNRR